MRFNYRSDEDKIKVYTAVKDWLDTMADVPPEEMAEFFEKRSDIYDEMRMDKFWNDYKIIPDFLPSHFDTMLSIGCGSGFEFTAIYEKYPDIKVTGIDKCTAMLDIFAQKFTDKAIILIEADYFEYPFEQNQYDVVLSVQSLHHFEYEKKKEIYNKIYAATMNNGFYYELDYMAQDEAFEKLNLEYYRNSRKKYNIPDDVFVHIDIPLTVEHQIELLKYAGFKEVEVLNKPFFESNSVYLKATK